MRRGRVFRRCSRCNREFEGKRCTRMRRLPDGTEQECGGERFSWCFSVDGAPAGSSTRKQILRGGFKTKAEAVTAMSSLQVAKHEGTYIEPSKQTVGEYLTNWLAAGCGDVRPWTRRGYESAIRVHLIPRIGQIPLQQLTQTQIKAAYQDIRTNGYAGGRSRDRLDNLKLVADRYRALASQVPPRAIIGKLVRELGSPESTVRYWVRCARQLGLLEPGSTVPVTAAAGPAAKRVSATTMFNAHITLRAALNDAVEAGLLRSNPARGALKPPSRRKVMKTWTVEELRAFLDVVKDDRSFALYRLAAQTGMRRGELLGLKWSDVKFPSSEISVQQQRTGLEEDEDDPEQLSPTKSAAGRRAISLAEATLQALRDHRAAQEFERRSWGAGYQDQDLVFCRADGSPHHPDTITGEFERLERDADLNSKTGSGVGTRTLNLAVNSRLLYRLSYSGSTDPDRHRRPAGPMAWPRFYPPAPAATPRPGTGLRFRASIRPSTSRRRPPRAASRRLWYWERTSTKPSPTSYPWS
jgi:integrase